METPTLQIFKKGESFKILKITGKKGMEMAEHHSTSEVVINIKKRICHFINKHQI
jgi:hypothetical protein